MAVVRTDPIDRATADDLISQVTDVGSVPTQVGAVLLLERSAPLSWHEATGAIAERITAVPRLRQRLTSTRLGCGRPVWADDAQFVLDNHLEQVECPGPGDEDALLAVAAEVIGRRLPGDRPLWRVAVVGGLEGNSTALVIAFHHVLADGIGGLAVLASLVDGAPAGVVDRFPRPAPSGRELALDAARTRLSALTRLPDALRRVRDGFGQLRPAVGAHPARCSLNRPTGSRRQFAVARVDLDGANRVAHKRGATVNDVILTAVGAALHTLLLGRGESVDRFVVSVPVSARRVATPTRLGNQVGVLPIGVPATGDLLRRLATVAATTRAAKRKGPATSAALLGPVFRLLVHLGIYPWFINHQRFVHTFVTNLRGPDARMSFLGTPIKDIIPIALASGNVTVSIAVLSYAGTLDVVVIADPSTCPDLQTLRDAIQDELHRLCES